SSVKMLLMALDEACMEMAKDIAKSTRGETEGLNILSNDKDDKVFDRVLTVISKVDSIKKISDLAQELRPDIEDFNELVKDLPKLDSSNPFEQAQKLIRDKRKGK